MGGCIAFQPPSAGSLVLTTKGDPVQPSDWLIINPRLSDLADYLRGEMELIAQIDAKCTADELREVPEVDSGELPSDEIPQRSARAVELPEPVDPRTFRVFREADEKLRKLGLTNEADEILERYHDGDTAGALEYVEALRTEWVPDNGVGVADVDRESEDSESDGAIPGRKGPIPPQSFYWDGVSFGGLPPTPFRLIQVLWSAPRRTAEYRKLGESVWDDSQIEPEKEAVGTARKAANHFFQTHGIPLRVAVKGLYVSLKDAPRESPADSP